MVGPHSKIHNSVLDTFKILKNSAIIDHEKEIQNNFVDMEKASNELFVLMDNMLAE